METFGNQEIEKLEITKKRRKKIEQLTFLDWKKPQEKEFPTTQSPIHPITYLSYSQIETFNLCPLKYKFRYILKIPSPASATASFGQTLHEILRSFYEMVKSGEKGTKELLLSLIDLKWIPLGYSSKQHEKRMRKEAEIMLSGYFGKMFDPKNIPLSLEENFIVPVSPNLRIGGKIDRVDRTGKKIEIIDYKTGRVPTDKEIENSLQMTVYALAAVNNGLYGKDPKDVLLSFYFFQEQKKVSGKRTKEQIAKAKKELLEKKKEMESSNFQPKVGKWCDFCEFKFICPAWEE